MNGFEIEFKSTELRKQTSQKGNDLYWQKAGMDQGGDWPIVFEVFCPDGRSNQPGKYTFLPAFKADQWGSLQIDPFNSKVLPLK